MKNLQVQCENPAIILNPNLKDLILLNRNYHCNGHSVTLDARQHARWYLDFPYRKFGRIKHNISVDDLSLYYVVDGLGEHQPIFMAVPCGKCVICTEKKANEWVTRAMTESQTSTSQPVFFTLTYNDFCLPHNGVRKGAMQRFMKRLRINVDRYCGFKTKIRYFICAEYGTKTKRPHYHGILWNLPLLQPQHLDDIIDKSWSFATNRKFYDSVPSDVDKYGHPVFKFYDEKSDIYRVKYGYTRVSICTDGRVRYAMKYMRKAAEIPYKKNDIFFLSSRKGGIGSQWIEDKLEEYRKNPSLLDVQLTDVWSGQQYRGCLPQYFKQKIAPSNCRLIKKEIRDTFKLWNWYSNKFHTFIGFDYSPNKRVLSHYPSLPYHRCKVYDKTAKIMLKDGNTDIDSFTRDYAKIIDYLEWKLLNYDYDVDLSVSTPLYKKKHLEYVETFINGLPAQRVVDKAHSIRLSRYRSQVREIF